MVLPLNTPSHLLELTAGRLQVFTDAHHAAWLCLIRLNRPGVALMRSTDGGLSTQDKWLADSGCTACLKEVLIASAS